jgi:hypothetical protein
MRRIKVRLWFFENTDLRRLFEPKREAMPGGRGNTLQ